MGVTLNFDATQVDPRQSKGGVCFPLAKYALEIVGIEAVPTKDDAKKGFLEITLRVLDGQYKGQEQVDRLNMYGQTEDIVAMAMRRLSAYAHIAGKLRVADSQELLGTKLVALIGPQEKNDKYSEVKTVFDLAGNVPVFGQPCAPQSTPIPQLADAAPASNGFGQGPVPVTGFQSTPAASAAPAFGSPAAAPPASAAWGGGAPASGAAAPPWGK